MKRFQYSVVAGGLLAGLMAFTQAADAQVGGCSNSSLQGTYGIQMTPPSNASATTMTSGGTGTGGSNTGSTTTGSTSTGAQAGSVTVAGPVAGYAVLYFDGNGNVGGSAAATSTGTSVQQNNIVGSYSVSNSCTVSISLSNPANVKQTFQGVIVEGGNEVFVAETDQNLGITGTMVRGRSFCSPTDFAGTYGFRSVANVVASGTTSSTGSGTGDGTGTGTGTGTGNTGANPGSTGTGSTATTSSPAYSSVGVITADPYGNIAVTETRFINGSSTTLSSNGTYTVNPDCSVSLSFNPAKNPSNPTGGTAGAALGPQNLRGVLVNNGVLSFQTVSGMGVLTEIAPLAPIANFNPAGR